MENFLHTENLTLRMPNTDLACELADYYRRNREFLRPYEPVRDEIFFEIETQRELLSDLVEKQSRGEAYRFYISQKENPEKIIWMLGLNNVIRGCFCSCFISYSLDENCINRGYMTEAVSVVVKYAFGELGLHRIEGNAMPRNKASLRVLKKCGFCKEGLAKKYLKINGVWEDHIHMVILNRDM